MNTIFTPTTRIFIQLILMAMLGALCRGVDAHASLEQEMAVSGSNYRGVLRISHGCNGSPTVAVRVRIPDGVMRTKPMPKAGWKLETVVMKLDEPYVANDATVTKEVRELIWKDGSLSDDFIDEFVFRADLPESTEEKTLYFRTLQECENGEFHRWIEVPGPDESAGDYREPAPSLRLLPGNGDEKR